MAPAEGARPDQSVLRAARRSRCARPARHGQGRSRKRAAARDGCHCACTEWLGVGRCRTFEPAATTAQQSMDPEAYILAFDLYGGELLPEDRYEDWASRRREALRDSHLQLLAELAQRRQQ